MSPTAKCTAAEKNATASASLAEPTILQRLADGDPSAMHDCMETYGGLVLSLARRQLGRIGEVEDGVQEVLVALWQSAHRFDPERGSEVAFVATLAQRKLIDHRRRNAAHRRVVVRSGVEGGRHADPAPAPSGNEFVREQADRAAEAMRDLPPAVQDTLSLSLYRGLSYRNIATAVGAPNGTIKSWASRGLQRLREKLRVGEQEPITLAEVA